MGFSLVLCVIMSCLDILSISNAGHADTRRLTDNANASGQASCFLAVIASNSTLFGSLYMVEPDEIT